MDTLSDRRSGQRGWKWALRKLAVWGIALMLLPFFATTDRIAYAASTTVNTLDDELNTDGDCSLREAIAAANTNVAVDACPAGAPAPTIDIITFGVTGTITLISGQLTVSDDLMIDGPGMADLTISGNHIWRVLEVGAGVTLDLRDVTVANGKWVSAPMLAGAGILNFGTLIVANSTFSGNDAGGTCCSDLPGGAIANSGGTVTVSNSLFAGNSAGGEGGGIYSANGTLTVSDSTFSANSTNNWGGGIFTNGGVLSVTNSTFDGNSDVYSGGGIGNIGGTVTVSNSTFTGNITTYSGGGGIWSQAGSLFVTNSTFVGNSATFSWFSQGGGIRTDGGVTVVMNSLFSGNSAGGGGAIWYEATSPSSFTLQNTIVTNSLAGGNCAGSITDGGGNLNWPDTTCPGMNQDPLLDPAGLQDNGGPTETLALQPGSPAIDTAVAASCPATDQRGVTRPQGAGCDIGPYELQQVIADTTPPAIMITAPADAATYLLGQVVLADYVCQDELGGSGVASCVGTVLNNSAVDTASIGAKTFTVNASDNAGNTNNASVSYNVTYAFDGFFSPVDNPPILNTAKAGQVIALKWRITDASGAPVTNLTSATITAVTLVCDLGLTTDQVEEYTSGASGLQNLGDGYYQLNWKSQKSYANSCKTLRLNLGDGVTHEALFKFTK